MKINAVYKISDNPVVYIGLGSNNWEKLTNNATQPAYLLVHTMWYLGLSSIPLYKKFERKLKKRNVRLILLCNSKREWRIAKLFGFRCYFVNQNIHVSEQTFYVKPGTGKIYDAVYTAQARKFKRLWLAKDVEKLYIVTYFWPDPCNDLHVFEPTIQHAEYNRDRIESNEVNDILNKSFCGLALSKKEGAMYAAVEYMFAGIPVVSTKSIGGRDVFFDNRYVIIVKDNAKSVAEGVKKAKQLNISPQMIRLATIEKINVHRFKFYNLIKNIHSENGKVYMNYESFYDLFFRKNGIDENMVMDPYGIFQ